MSENCMITYPPHCANIEGFEVKYNIRTLGKVDTAGRQLFVRGLNELPNASK
jgi:hypothetical protein